MFKLEEAAEEESVSFPHQTQWRERKKPTNLMTTVFSVVSIPDSLVGRLALGLFFFISNLHLTVRSGAFKESLTKTGIIYVPQPSPSFVITRNDKIHDNQSDDNPVEN